MGEETAVTLMVFREDHFHFEVHIAASQKRKQSGSAETRVVPFY